MPSEALLDVFTMHPSDKFVRDNSILSLSSSVGYDRWVKCIKVYMSAKWSSVSPASYCRCPNTNLNTCWPVDGTSLLERCFCQLLEVLHYTTVQTKQVISLEHGVINMAGSAGHLAVCCRGSSWNSRTAQIDESTVGCKTYTSLGL